MMPLSDVYELKWMRSFKAIAVSLLVTSLVGCAPPPSKPPARPTMRVDLTPVDKTTFDRVLFENTGRVVLVNFWATWDDASMRQLVHMKVLQEVYGMKGFQLILVSLDNEAGTAAATQFLKSLRAIGAVHLISVNGADAQSFGEFEIPNESLPYYVLYDRMGVRAKTYAGAADGIEQQIDALLRQTDFDKVTPDRR